MPDVAEQKQNSAGTAPAGRGNLQSASSGGPGRGGGQKPDSALPLKNRKVLKLEQEFNAREPVAEGKPEYRSQLRTWKRNEVRGEAAVRQKDGIFFARDFEVAAKIRRMESTAPRAGSQGEPDAGTPGAPAVPAVIPQTDPKAAVPPEESPVSGGPGLAGTPGATPPLGGGGQLRGADKAPSTERKPGTNSVAPPAGRQKSTAPETGPAGDASAPEDNPADDVQNVIQSLKKNQRPGAKAVLDFVEKVQPEFAPAIKIVRKGLKYLGENEEDIAEILWPKKDLVFNPAHVQKIKLVLVVARISRKLFFISLALWAVGVGAVFIIFLIIVLTVACNNILFKTVIVFSGGGQICSAFGLSSSGVSGVATTTAATNKPVAYNADPNAPLVAGDFATIPTEPVRGLVGNGTCQPVAFGPAGQESLSQTCFGGNAAAASAMAGFLSGGYPASVGDGTCGSGNPTVFGLYQIDITKTPVGGLDCPAAFSRTVSGGRNSACYIVNQDLYRQCVTAAKDADQNVQAACIISKNGSDWSAWSAADECGL